MANNIVKHLNALNFFRLGILLVAIWLIYIASTPLLADYRQNLDTQSWVATDATVEDSNLYPDGDERTATLTVRYTFNGQSMRAWVDLPPNKEHPYWEPSADKQLPLDHPNGSHYKVLVNPSHPDMARTPEFSNRPMDGSKVFLLGLGVILVLLSLLPKRYIAPSFSAAEEKQRSFWARYLGIAIFLVMSYFSISEWFQQQRNNANTPSWILTEAQVDGIRTTTDGNNQNILLTTHYSFKGQSYRSTLECVHDGESSLGAEAKYPAGASIKLYVNPLNPNQTREIQVVAPPPSNVWGSFHIGLFWLAIVLFIPDKNTNYKTYLGYLISKYRRRKRPISDAST